MLYQEANDFKELLKSDNEINWDKITDEEFGFVVGQLICIFEKILKKKILWEKYINNVEHLNQCIIQNYKLANYKILDSNRYVKRLLMGSNGYALSHADEPVSDEIQHALILGYAFE